MNRREEFINKLQLLLEEFDCNLFADDFYQGYPECGQDVRMIVEFSDWAIESIDLGGGFFKNTEWGDVLKESK